MLDRQHEFCLAIPIYPRPNPRIDCTFLDLSLPFISSLASGVHIQLGEYEELAFQGLPIQLWCMKVKFQDIQSYYTKHEKKI